MIRNEETDRRECTDSTSDISVSTKTAPHFTDEDQLRLLQLSTRRAMADRQRRSAAKETFAADDDAALVANPPAEETPSQWRLVSESTSLYDWQRNALSLWLAEGRGTVKVATGGGKTLFALAAAQQLQNEREPDLRLVIVVPTIPLMFQWHDDIRQGNLPEAAIGLMGGGRELSPTSDLRVLICVLASARERLPGFVSKTHWAPRMLLVVDECHRANAAQARRIFDAKPRYTLGLSATPEQDLEAETLPSDEAYQTSVVGQALGPIIYDFTIKQSLDAGLLTPFEVWHLGLLLTPQEAKEHGELSREITELRKPLLALHRRSRSKQGFLAWCQSQASHGGPVEIDAARFIGLANRRKRLLYHAAARTDVSLVILSETVADPESRAIVFHEAIDEIERLFLQAEKVGLPAVLEHSQLPDSLRGENINAFRTGVARVIISAKSLVEGFNVPSADLGIIAASSSSVRQRIQSLGRMLRRKAGGRSARIVVLYIRDTEDEAIYEKADWENVVGAERNRYFHWSANTEGKSWLDGLQEQPKAPRLYRPPSWEIDVRDLNPGDLYPAQPDGVDFHVDQSGNLRTDDDTLVPAPSLLVQAILAHNIYRRARRTPAGHLIVRVDSGNSSEAEWRFLGTIDLPEESDAGTVTRLRIRMASGRRVIALDEEDRKKGILFALGANASRTSDGGEARDRLLEWVRGIEAERGVEVKEIYWDNRTRYWLEIGGERIPYAGALAPLEFQR